MEMDYRVNNPYRPVCYRRRDHCVHNSLRSEFARGAFQMAEFVDVSYLQPGKGAIFILRAKDEEPRTIGTSKVLEISRDGKDLHITTENSVYVLSEISDAG